MLRKNQRGSIDYLLYGVATISVLLFLFFLVITLTNPSEQVVTGGDVVQEQETSSGFEVTIPEGWHTYTNPENDYSFSYPADWGAVTQTSYVGERLESESYEYRFTSNEQTVISQVSGRSDETEHQASYLNYNWFKQDSVNVTICNTLDCAKNQILPTQEVRLFTSATMKEGVEVRSLDGADLKLVQIINTEYGDWPGVVVSTLLQENVDTTRPLEDIVHDAITNNYIETELIREFSNQLQ